MRLLPVPTGGSVLVVRCDCGDTVEIVSHHANQCPCCCREYDGRGDRLLGAFTHANLLADLLDDETDDDEVDALLLPRPAGPPAFGDYHAN